MRQKKRYVRLREYPEIEGLEFIFQDQDGYVFKTTPETAEKVRSKAILISGSMKKLKLGAKRAKS